MAQHDSPALPEPTLPEPTPPRSATRPGWTLVITSMAFFMTALDSLAVVTALPRMRADLHAPLSTLEWTVNAFTLTCAAGIITAAALGDRLGRRRVFVAGMALFTLASAGCAVAPNAGALIAARAAQGLGAAVVLPVSLTILISAFPAAKRGAVVGVFGGIGGLAIASGPLVGGAVTQGLDWHWIFWLNVPVGLVTIVAASRLLTESRGARTRLDLPAVALVTAATTGLIAGLIRAASHGFRDPGTGVLLGLGAVLLAGFLVWESRVAEPMLPPGLFRSRQFSAATVTGFLMSGTIFSAAFLIAQWFQLARLESPVGTGLRILPWTATPLVVAPLAGRLSDRIGTRPVLVTGMVLQALGLAWIAELATINGGYPRLVVPLIVAGVGVSMTLPTIPAAALGGVAPADIGKASGVNSTVQRFGAAFGIAAATAVFAAHGNLGTPAAFTNGFRPALGFAAALSLLGAVSALAVGRRTTASAQPLPPAAVPPPAPTESAGVGHPAESVGALAAATPIRPAH